MEEAGTRILDRSAGEVSAKELSEQLRSYEDLLQRLKADFENYKKRAARHHIQAGDAAKKEFLSKLLEVYDSMELALQRDDSGSPELESFLEGLRMIHNRLSEILEEEGVVTVGTEGEEFNPEVHEAVMIEDAEEEGQSGRVAKELKKGFKYKNWLLRPAKVVVYKESDN